MPDTLPPQINEAGLNALGQRMFAIWPTYVDDRKPLEERWLRNLRQVRGIYDPEVAIPKDKSKAYPKMTAWVVRGTVARLMQLLFPMTEKNYGVRPSPLPDLPTEQLQEVLDQLVAAKGGDPAAVMLTDAEIEKAILEFAKGKAERMQVKIDDDLTEMEHITLIRKVVRSAVVYNVGILEGPLHRKVKSRTWQHDQFTGKWIAVEVDKLKPFFEFVPVWEHYPDLTAVSIDKQDGKFRRYVMTRADVQALAERPDFIVDRIHDWLRKNPEGNYKSQWWEESLKGEPKSAQSTVSNKQGRKYELLSYWGDVTGHELRASGTEVKEADLGKCFHANVWTIDGIVIKAKLAPLGGEIKRYHYFVFEDDDLSILGNGQVDTLRDSQLSICETARAALDNASVIGPMAEVFEEFLAPGQSTAIAKHKTWLRESQGGNADQVPAVRNIEINSHIPDLINLMNVFMTFSEKESGLPPPSVGDMSGGGSEALRTSKNASMFLGAAALPIRDTVRNFDTFTISMISALVAWNTKFDPNPSRDGDHDIIARGSTSLIAKEVLATSLAEFRTTITPDEAPHVKSRGLLIERAKANDIPIDVILEDEDKANATIERNAQAQSAQLAAQQALIESQVRETLAKAFGHMAKAEAEEGNLQVEIANSMIEALKAGDKTMAEHVKAANQPKKEPVKEAA